MSETLDKRGSEFSGIYMKGSEIPVRRSIPDKYRSLHSPTTATFAEYFIRTGLVPIPNVHTTEPTGMETGNRYFLGLKRRENVRNSRITRCYHPGYIAKDDALKIRPYKRWNSPK